jgi:YfiH family protein
LSAAYLTASGFPARHGFFTRRGGVSTGPYASLNCSVSSADDPENVRRNRALVAEAMDVAPGHLVGVSQVHGRDVVRVQTPWVAGQGPKADAMVTGTPGIALGVVTADCAPVLFSDLGARVVGAAHAGWRGASIGVLDATIEAMLALGAARDSLVAAIGPCIAQASYEVAGDMRSAVLAADASAAMFFAPGHRDGHWQFDLPGYCAARLARHGVRVLRVDADTFADEAGFFSHRRRTLHHPGPIGHQISAITPCP